MSKNEEEKIIKINLRKFPGTQGQEFPDWKVTL